MEKGNWQSLLVKNEESLGLILKEIREHRQEFQDHAESDSEASKKVDQVHLILSTAIENFSHLAKLDKLESIDKSLINLNTNMVGPATDGNRIPKEVFKEVLVKTVSVFSWITLGLTMIIVFLLTGIKFGWINGH